MGTRAFFSITSKNDHLALYTRWDGFEQEIIQNSKNLVDIHQSNLDFLKKNTNLSSFMQEWIEDYQTLISEYQKNNNITLYSKLFSILSFSHIYPIPIFNDFKEVDFNYTDYDFNLSINSKKIVKKANIDLNVNSLGDYKILRIYENEKFIDKNTDLKTLRYIDVKYKDIDTEKLIKEIHLLPFFLREFQFSMLPLIQGKIDWKNNLIRLSSKISDFYNDSLGLQIRYHAPFNSAEEELKILQDRLDFLHNMIPFDLHIGTLNIHLFLRFPKNVFPLTYSEAIFSNTQEPDSEIFLIGERFHHIGSKINKEIIDNESEQLINDFESTNESDSFIQLKFKSFEKDYTYTAYEENCAYVLNYLSTIKIKRDS